MFAKKFHKLYLQVANLQKRFVSLYTVVSIKIKFKIFKSLSIKIFYNKNKIRSVLGFLIVVRDIIHLLFIFVLSQIWFFLKIFQM